MLRLELTSVVSRVHQILRKQPTLKVEEMPKLYHEPGVLSGYRLPGQSVFTYILSAFQINNETVNIWTHFVGFVAILLRTLIVLDEFGTDDPRIFPLLGFGICCMVNTALSVTAHAIHSASPSIHYTCFQADYAGIGFYAFGSALHIFYLGADDQTRIDLSFWFLPINFIFSWFCFLCCCIAKLRYRRPYPFARKLWHVVPFGLHMLTTASLLYGRTLRCYFEAEVCSDPGLVGYRNVFFLASLGAVTYSSHFPERFWPGCFDFIGQGHHVFHVVSVILYLAQFNTASEDILHNNQDIILNDNIMPSLSCILCVIVGFGAFSVLTIVLLRPFVLERIKADEKIEKQR